MSAPMAPPIPTLTEDGERILFAGVEIAPKDIGNLCDRLRALQWKAEDTVRAKQFAGRHASERFVWIGRYPVHGPLTEEAGGGFAHVNEDGKIVAHRDRPFPWSARLHNIVSYPVVVPVRAKGARTVHLWRGGSKLLCGADAPMVLGDPRTCSRECAACTAARPATPSSPPSILGNGF